MVMKKQIVNQRRVLVLLVILLSVLLTFGSPATNPYSFNDFDDTKVASNVNNGVVFTVPAIDTTGGNAPLSSSVKVSSASTGDRIDDLIEGFKNTLSATTHSNTHSTTTAHTLENEPSKDSVNQPLTKNPPRKSLKCTSVCIVLLVVGLITTLVFLIFILLTFVWCCRMWTVKNTTHLLLQERLNLDRAV